MVGPGLPINNVASSETYESRRQIRNGVTHSGLPVYSYTRRLPTGPSDMDVKREQPPLPVTSVSQPKTQFAGIGPSSRKAAEAAQNGLTHSMY